MSASEAVSQSRIESTNGKTDLELDVDKLHSLPSEQQDLYLLNFVSDLLRHVEGFDSESLPSHQAAIKKELLKIVGLASPTPSRVIRNTLGYIFADIFRRGSRNLLYETINDLTGFVTSGKGEKELKIKHAAVVCIGQIFRAAGGSAASLANLACSSLIRLMKQAQGHAGLRGSIFRALALTIEGVGHSIDEQIARDILKQARNGASNDKAVFVQRTACSCLQVLHRSTQYLDNGSDFDSLKSTIWKAIDSPNTAVRHAAADALAVVLIKALTKDSTSDDVPTIRKPKKTAKKQGAAVDEEGELERPGSPSLRKPNTLLALSLQDACKTLSNHYCKASTSNRARAGIAICYKRFLQQLPDKFVEENYGIIADHMFSDILDHPTISYNRYRSLITRKYVAIILEDTIASKILSENAQLTAARWLINNVLKNYPQVLQERREPSKRALVSALSALSNLISCLGSAMSVMSDACREALLQVVQHPSYTVQIHVAECFSTFVLACPQQLLICSKHCMNQLVKELSQLSEPRHSHRRCISYANTLAAVLNTARSRPLYGCVETFSQVLATATDLLKSSSSSELRVSATQIQVAWILIGGLMPLGPNFVKIHLAQLLLLWRNALRKPLSRDNAAKRGSLEMSFLAHVRECALGAMLVFLEYNSSLVTTDSSRRLATMLQNCVLFLQGLPVQRHLEEVSARINPALPLQDYKIMVRRRVLQCFSKLVSITHLENSEVSIQADLLSLAMLSFTEPENAAPRSFDALIASYPGNFENLWDLEDNWGFGVTGSVRGYQVRLPGSGAYRPINESGLAGAIDPIDDLLLSPTCHAREHDSVFLYNPGSRHAYTEIGPAPTQVVDAAIELFAIALPLHPPKIQESALERMATVLAQPLPREPGKKAAVLVNTSMAILGALSVANRETKYSKGRIATSAIEKIVAEILRRSIAEPDGFVRNLGVEALGRLSHISGSQFTNTEVNHLIETIVANRDPSIRAGCALALGCIHSQVGGMAASFHLKTIVGVLLSLCNDPHPVVHFWAIEGLRRVADSAGLTFSAFVTSTLGMLAQLYMNDTHTNEAASLATSNIEDEYSTPLCISQCVDSLINVLGPDLQDAVKTTSLILTLVAYFRREDSVAISTVSSICSGHLSLYAPGHVNFVEYVRALQTGLSSRDEYVRDVSLEGLANTIKRNASIVFEAAEPGLKESIWLCLDMAPNHGGLQTIIRNWLQQTFLTETAQWVQQCHSILSKTRTKAESALPATTVQTATAAPDLQDEEVAGFAAAAAAAQGDRPETSTEAQEFLKWHTRSFAMSILSELLNLVAQAMLPDRTIPAETALQSKIADVVRMAFSASTATVIELRIWGLKILDQILKLFGKTPDPDFVEASLLEQYQAQIGSALTPAFAADSSPELAAEAISVCATFVATGIVTNVDRMGRIFKLLVTGLENCTKPSGDAAIGELRGLSTNGQVMLRMAVLSAWAQLQISSSEQEYLADIVQPYVARLTPLWLSALQEFAKLRFEPEISSTLGGDIDTGNLDVSYAALNRETRLKFYQDTWLNLVDAIAILVDKDSDFVFDALDDKLGVNGTVEANGLATEGKDISFREEPVAFFFILYGLAFEALVISAREDASQTLAILQALKKILRPAVAGNAVYQDVVFGETTDAFDRLAMMGGLDTQTVLVEIARNLSLDHLSAKDEIDRNDKLSDDIDQLFELTRIVILVLAGLVPTLKDSPGPSSSLVSEKGAALVLLSLEALVDVADVFPSVIRADLYACIIHTFCTILATGMCQAEVVPQAFPIFRRFLLGVTVSSGRHTDSVRLVRGCLSQLLTILSRAQLRENEAALPCARNTYLAITILLTSVGRILPQNDPLVAKAISELLESLQDLGLAKVAATCIRTLLLAKPKSPCEEAAARLLYPRVLHFVTDLATEDPESVSDSLVHTLTSSVATLSNQSSRSAGIAMIIPALLIRAEGLGQDSCKEISMRLLEMAAVEPLAFRSCVVLLTAERRSLLEGLLRSSGGLRKQTGRDGADNNAKPTIELRMDF
jgi:HEAT repeat-containing protein 5